MDLELNIVHKKQIAGMSIFIYTLILVFSMTIFQRIFPGFKINFSNSQKIPAFNNVLPKLQKTPNDFKVKTVKQIFTPVFASSSFNNASAYAVVDYDTGEIIESKNISEQLPVASLTKIMTAIVTLDLTKPDELITISKKSSKEKPTTIGVVPGQKMTVEELLNALLLTSANDAAQALKDGINEKYKGNIFEQAMNRKAQIIGLNESYFTNPQGYDFANNHSSAEDLAIITRYALNNYPLIRQIVAKEYQFYPATSLHKQFDLYNWNGLLGVYPGVTGMKIGNTDSAGYSIIAVSKRGEKKFIAVLLGAPGILERDLWTSQLLDFSFNKTLGLPPIALGVNDLRHKYSTWKFWN